MKIDFKIFAKHTKVIAAAEKVADSYYKSLADKVYEREPALLVNLDMQIARFKAAIVDAGLSDDIIFRDDKEVVRICIILKKWRSLTSPQK